MKIDFMSKLIILLAVFFIFFTTSAQEKGVNDTLISEDIINNLDQLMTLWYVKQGQDTFLSSKGLDHKENIPDSVIIKRFHYIITSIPLTFNYRVRRWIDFYLKQEMAIPTFLGVGNVYFPMFEQVLDKYGLPLELKYLPIIESAFNVRARSRAGAVGLWQIMYGTARLYGLEINSLVDERMDPFKSTEAAARILKDLYNKYQNWYLVLAAYNAGPGNVNKAIRRSGGKRDFWQIYPYLPRETRGYVPGFIAIVYLMNYAKEHNYFEIKVNVNLVSDTVMITDTLHLKQVAEVLNIPIEELRDLNPQYKIDIIPGHVKPYPLRLPIDKVLSFISYEDSIYNYKDSVFFPKNIIIKVNTRAYYARGSASTPCYTNTKGKVKLYYTVKPGDTFGHIADWYDVTIKEVKCWNNRWSNKLRVGEKIIVYVPASKVNLYKKINQLSFEQKQKLTGTPVVNITKPNDPNYVYYQVKRGESLYSIARKFPGISYNDLIKINGFTEYQLRHLKPGQWIKIKKKN